MRVNAISTTGQYSYMALIDKKLSHINRPKMKRKKQGSYLYQHSCDGMGKEAYLSQLAPVQSVSSVIFEDENIVYFGPIPDHAI